MQTINSNCTEKSIGNLFGIWDIYWLRKRKVYLFNHSGIYLGWLWAQTFEPVQTAAPLLARQAVLGSSLTRLPWALSITPVLDQPAPGFPSDSTSLHTQTSWNCDCPSGFFRILMFNPYIRIKGLHVAMKAQLTLDGMIFNGFFFNFLS